VTPPSSQKYSSGVFWTYSSIKRPFIGSADTFDIKMGDTMKAKASATVFTDGKVVDAYGWFPDVIEMKASLDSAVTTAAGAMALLATALYF